MIVSNRNGSFERVGCQTNLAFVYRIEPGLAWLGLAWLVKTLSRLWFELEVRELGIGSGSDLKFNLQFVN